MSATNPQSLPSLPKASLYYRDGGSDKVYHAQIEPRGNGYVVNFQYGRRFQSLQSGTKTQEPVDLAKATKIFDKLVAEKTAKGYTFGEDGTPHTVPENAGRISGFVPQLLNPIEEEEVESYIKDDAWMMQEKKDGVNCAVRLYKKTVEGINRKGLVVALPKTIEDVFLNMPNTCLVSGERIGDVFYAFDLIEFAEQSLRPYPAVDRHFSLRQHFSSFNGPYFKVLTNYETTKEKRDAFINLKNVKAEGVVFKKKNSLFVSGRPASKGNQVKFKFLASGSFYVSAVNNKRSVLLGVLSDGSLGQRTVGNVTIPANQPVPKVGDILEVRYLYAYPEGSLFQPVSLGVRDDKDLPDEYSTLKFKQDNEDDES